MEYYQPLIDYTTELFDESKVSVDKRHSLISIDCALGGLTLVCAVDMCMISVYNTQMYESWFNGLVGEFPSNIIFNDQDKVMSFLKIYKQLSK